MVNHRTFQLIKHFSKATAVAETTFDRFGHTDLRFKGEYLKLEIYAWRLNESLEFGVMQSINQSKLSASVQQIWIAKHYLMINNIVTYYFKAL